MGGTGGGGEAESLLVGAGVSVVVVPAEDALSRRRERDLERRRSLEPMSDPLRLRRRGILILSKPIIIPDNDRPQHLGIQCEGEVVVRVLHAGIESRPRYFEETENKSALSKMRFESQLRPGSALVFQGSRDGASLSHLEPLPARLFLQVFLASSARSKLQAPSSKLHEPTREDPNIALESQTRHCILKKGVANGKWQSGAPPESQSRAGHPSLSLSSAGNPTAMPLCLPISILVSPQMPPPQRPPSCPSNFLTSGFCRRRIQGPNMFWTTACMVRNSTCNNRQRYRHD